MLCRSRSLLLLTIIFVTPSIFYTLWSIIEYKSEEIYLNPKFGTPNSVGELWVDPKVKDKVRRILWWTTTWGENVGYFGYGNFFALKSLEWNCKFKCEFTTNKKLAIKSHALIFWAWNNDLKTETVTENGSNITRAVNPPKYRDQNQYYVYMTSESPIRFKNNLEPYRNFFNWTIVSRLDADFPLTYGRFQRKSPNEIKSYVPPTNLNSFPKRSNLAAWIVSNCEDTPSQRTKMVAELQKHMAIDVYGKCGNKTCPKGWLKDQDCYNELGESYKFYLSFENSLCRDYVTEKYFNALDANMVPIVYGKANYGSQFAPGSYIDVDTFPSAKSLANYLKYLDENDEEYLKYFRWKKYYRLQLDFPLEKIYCQLCERLHKEYGLRHSYLDIVDWLFKNNSDSPICSHPIDEFN